MRIVTPLAFACLLIALSGCHSHYIAASISNQTKEPLSPVELDYPSASLGTESLAPGAKFHYRFKVLGSGATELIWSDASHKDHKAAGPSLAEGDEGQLQITISASAAPTWTLHLANRTTN